jgi:hypothetical protein
LEGEALLEGTPHKTAGKHAHPLQLEMAPNTHTHTITQDLTRLCNANIKTQCPNSNSPFFFPATADILLPLKRKTHKQNSSLNCRTHTTTAMRAKTLNPKTLKPENPKTSSHSEKAMD